MKSLQKFHGKLTCHPSCRGEGCGSSTISCTILLMPAARMLDEKNWWLNLELGTQSVCRTEAGWCMLAHRNPTTTKNKETWCQRLRFLPFLFGFPIVHPNFFAAAIPIKISASQHLTGLPTVPPSERPHCWKWFPASAATLFRKLVADFQCG